MNEETKLLEKYNIYPIKIFYKNKTKIIITENEKYILKPKKNNSSIYEYLKNRKFNNFLEPENTKDTAFELYRYIEDANIGNQEKAQDLITTVIDLHKKTAIYESVDLDTVKKIYEDISNKITDLDEYYHSTQDLIENDIYMSPSKYLLIKNISKIYSALYFSKSKINTWYNLKSNAKTERKVVVHNNLNLSHFLEDDKNYLINWSKSKKDYIIYDFLSLYKNEFENLEMISLFDYYQKNVNLTDDELELFNALIAMPWKIEFTKNNYIDTLNVKKLVDYVEKTDVFISKENKKNQKAHDEKLQE